MSMFLEAKDPYSGTSLSFKFNFFDKIERLSEKYIFLLKAGYKQIHCPLSCSGSDSQFLATDTLLYI